MNKLQWINIDGSVVDEAQGMANNSHISDEDIALVLQGNSLADMSRLVFRDPDHFLAGELHRHAPQWNALLNDMNDERFSEVRDWITNGVDVTKFFRPFKGSYKGRNYECGSPPPCAFPNHLSCKPFASFISDTLLDRLRSGAISLWGKVGECTPPQLIMPSLSSLASRVSATTIDFLICGSKTVRLPWIASNTCLSMSIKDFTKQCATTSQDMTTSNFTPAVELTLASSGEVGIL